MNQQTVQSSRSEKNKVFFQGKQLFNTKPLLNKVTRGTTMVKKTSMTVALLLTVAISSFALSQPTPGTIQFGLDKVILPSVCGPATASIVDEPTAPTGKAIYQPCPITHWSIQWPITPTTFQNAKGKYVVRIRVKCGPLKLKKGKVFQFGLYCAQAKHIFLRHYKVAELSQKKYIWLKAAVIDIPHSKMTLYAGPVKNSAAKYIYVDSVEFIPESEYNKLEK